MRRAAVILSRANWSAWRPVRRVAKAPAQPFPWTGYRDPATGRYVAQGGQPLTRYRDALTGHYASAPGPTAGRARVTFTRDRSGLITLTRFTVWEGGDREPVGCRVIWPAYRAARLRGEVTAAQLREVEAETAGGILAHLNPARMAEWELEQMHAAHRSDKAKRGAQSRKRNAQARALDAANPNRRINP